MISNHLRCPLCNSPVPKNLLINTSHLYANYDSCLFRCNECSFVFTAFSQHFYDIQENLYNDSYDCYIQPSTNIVSKFRDLFHYFFLKLSFFRQKICFSTSWLYRLSRLLQLPIAILKGRFRSIAWDLPLTFPKCTSFIDIGCGNGHWIKSMHRQSYMNLYAQDINKNSLGLLSQFCKEVYFMDVESLSRQGLTFDVIRINQVLEHIPDPVNFMLSIQKICHPNSIIIITVPSLNSLSFVFRSFYTSLMIPYHLNHFTPYTLSMLLSMTNFNIERQACRGVPEVFVDSLSVSISSILSPLFHKNRLYLYGGIKRLLYPLAILISPIWLLSSFFGYSEEIEVVISTNNG